MKQVTAVEYLLNELQIRLPEIEWSNYGEEIQRAKKMEKQQMIYFAEKTRYITNDISEYYTEIYKSE